MTTPLHLASNQIATAATESDVSVPIIQEEARIEKRSVEDGRVRITTHTEVVEERVRETLKSDNVEVERIAVNRTLTPGEAAPTVRTEGDVTIIPVLEEIVVVEKRLVLKEELHIRRETTSDEVEVPVTLRKQRADVERTQSAETTLSNDKE